MSEEPKTFVTSPYWYFKPFALKKKTFRSFLEQSGILSHITRVLGDLYDTQRKPPYPLHFFRKNFVYLDPETPNIQLLIELLNDKRAELDEIREYNKQLKRELVLYDEEFHFQPIPFKPIRKKKTTFEEYTLSEFWGSSSSEKISTVPPFALSDEKSSSMMLVKQHYESSSPSSGGLSPQSLAAMKVLKKHVEDEDTSESDAIDDNMLIAIEELRKKQKHVRKLKK